MAQFTPEQIQRAFAGGGGLVPAAGFDSSKVYGSMLPPAPSYQPGMMGRGSNGMTNGNAALSQINAALASAPATRYAVDAQGQRIDPIALGYSGNSQPVNLTVAGGGTPYSNSGWGAPRPSYSAASPVPAIATASNDVTARMGSNPLFGTKVGGLAGLLGGKQPGLGFNVDGGGFGALLSHLFGGGKPSAQSLPGMVPGAKGVAREGQKNPWTAAAARERLTGGDGMDRSAAGSDFNSRFETTAISRANAGR